MALRVMIVEDDPLIGLDLETILDDAGHSVVGVYRDMHAALDAAGSLPVDFATMDIELALGTNGLETAAALRERHDIPSLFVSSRYDGKIAQLAAKSRPIGFIMKPYRGADILAILAMIDSE